MLLLLMGGFNPDELSADLNLAEHFTSSKSYIIEELFEVKSGVLEERFLDYYTNDNGEKEDVFFIKMLSIKDDGTIELPIEREKINEVLEHKALKSQKLTENNLSGIAAKKKEIPFERILRPEDFLISTRGIPMGISLIFECENGMEVTFKNLVPTHHLIVVRPKADIIEHNKIDLKLLHLILSLIVENVYKVTYKKQIQEAEIMKQKEIDKNPKAIRRSKASFFASVKVDDVKKQKITIPVSFENQIALYAQMNEIEKEMQKAIRKNEAWRKILFSKIENKI